jgi:TonB-dependent SusC/RagA subfamily outer membrane receptor
MKKICELFVAFILSLGGRSQNSSDSVNSDINKALWVLDGKIATKEDFDKLIPQDIGSIDVLKGKSATAIYGDKAAKGVILVRSKARLKEEYWSVFCAKSTEYFELIKSPAADSIVNL